MNSPLPIKPRTVSVLRPRHLHRVFCWANVILLLALLRPQYLAAQRQPGSAPPTDTTHKTVRDTMRNTEQDDGSDDQSPRFSTGVSAGSQSYVGGRSERALAAMLQWRAMPWLTLSVAPSYVSASEPGTTSRLSASGLTDIPISIEAGHSFSGSLSPSIGIGYGITLPVGDTLNGFGSGQVGSSLNIGAGIMPAPNFGLNAGVGRSLSTFSIRSGINGTASMWGDVSAWLQPAGNDRMSFSAGYSTDLGSVDTTFGRSTSLNLGFNVRLFNQVALNVDATHGLSGASPEWGLAIGFGTAFPSLGSGRARSAVNQLSQVFGGGRHGLPSKKSGTGTTTGTGIGRGGGRKKP